jgi:hypothetical protein
MNDDVEDDMNDDIEDDMNDDIEEYINNDIEEEDEVYKPQIIKKHLKYSKKHNVSNGVEDIHKLPLDWFNATRQNYKQNQIIPRKKELTIDNIPASKNSKFNIY